MDDAPRPVTRLRVEYHDAAGVKREQIFTVLADAMRDWEAEVAVETFRDMLRRMVPTFQNLEQRAP